MILSILKNFQFLIINFQFLVVLCCLCCLPDQVAAQRPSQASATTRQASATTRRDTLALAYTLALNPEKTLLDADTLPNNTFRMYDPVRRQTIDWGHLGHVGTPARPLLFEPSARRGFDAGFHGFDLYRMKATDLRFGFEITMYIANR